jgi:hypothetical protein
MFIDYHCIVSALRLTATTHCKIGGALAYFPCAQLVPLPRKTSDLQQKRRKRPAQKKNPPIPPSPPDAGAAPSSFAAVTPSVVRLSPWSKSLSSSSIYVVESSIWWSGRRSSDGPRFDRLPGRRRCAPPPHIALRTRLPFAFEGRINGFLHPPLLHRQFAFPDAFSVGGEQAQGKSAFTSSVGLSLRARKRYT